MYRTVQITRPKGKEVRYIIHGLEKAAIHNLNICSDRDLASTEILNTRDEDKLNARKRREK